MDESVCFNKWVVYQNSKGHKKWVNEGPAPDGVCPDCPDMVYPENGRWDGFSARCLNGAIVQMVSDGSGGLRAGAVIKAATSLAGAQACLGNNYVAIGPISNYFP